MKLLARRPILAANVYYNPPADKELQLYDFYASELIYHLLSKGPPDTRSFARLDESSSDYASAQEAVVTITAVMRHTILESIFQAVAGELRHLRGMNDNVTPKTRTMMNRYFREYGARNKESKLTGFKDEFDRAKQHGYVTAEPDRAKGIVSAIEAMAGNKTSFMNAAENAFREGSWGSSYGGPKWADICAGWLILNKAQSIPERYVAIDHCLDLEHNNNTVFDKIPGYAKSGGYGWIKKALDFKYKSDVPELLQKCSSQMRKIGMKLINAYNPALMSRREEVPKKDLTPKQEGGWTTIEGKFQVNGSAFFEFAPPHYPNSKESLNVIFTREFMAFEGFYQAQTYLRLVGFSESEIEQIIRPLPTQKAPNDKWLKMGIDFEVNYFEWEIAYQNNIETDASSLKTQAKLTSLIVEAGGPTATYDRFFPIAESRGLAAEVIKKFLKKTNSEPEKPDDYDWKVAIQKLKTAGIKINSYTEALFILEGDLEIIKSCLQDIYFPAGRPPFTENLSDGYKWGPFKNGKSLAWYEEDNEGNEPQPPRRDPEPY